MKKPRIFSFRGFLKVNKNLDYPPMPNPAMNVEL